MPRAGLTPKREKFAQLMGSGKNPSEAYRLAFDAQNMKPETIRKRAGELAANGAVRGRVAELTQKAADAVGITLESHLRDLMILRNAALKASQISAAVTAEIARGKHSGVAAPEKRELGGPGGGPIPVAAVDVSHLTPEQLRLLASLKVPHAGD